MSSDNDFDDSSLASAWNANADEWVTGVREGRDLIRSLFNTPAFFEFLPPVAGLTVVDLGCGEGENTRLLASRGARMIGIELSPSLCAAAVEREQSEPLGIEYRLGSFCDLSDIPVRSIDAVVSTMAFMGSPGLSQSIKEAARILRPGGWLAFSVTHPCFSYSKARWVRMDRGEVLVIRDYFCHGREWVTWNFGEDIAADQSGKIRSCDAGYRLEDIINSVAEAGLFIRRIQEPVPTADMVFKMPMLERYRLHAGLFLYLLADKSQGRE